MLALLAICLAVPLSLDARSMSGAPRILRRSTESRCGPVAARTEVPLTLQLLCDSGISDELETLNDLFIDQLNRLREEERCFANEMSVSSFAIDGVSKLYRNLEVNNPGSGLTNSSQSIPPVSY
jgi:hypothetical protein